MSTDKQPFLQDLQARLAELIRTTPAADVERNMKALLGQAFQRFELVTREELDACHDMLASLSSRVARLEQALAAVEQARAGTAGPAAQTPARPDDPSA